MFPFTIFFNVATRNFKITCVAHICSMHPISVGLVTLDKSMKQYTIFFYLKRFVILLKPHYNPMAWPLPFLLL